MKFSALIMWLALAGAIAAPVSAGNSDELIPPKAVLQVPPEYPYSMRYSGNKGLVVLDFVVDREGRVRDVSVVKSSHPDFEAPAVEALLQWKFHPGLNGGGPMDTRMRIPVEFLLRTGPFYERPTGVEPWSVISHASIKSSSGLKFEPPQPGLAVAPVYPYDLRRQKVEGSASISFIVDRRGETDEIKVISATRPEFGASLAAMMAAWRFTPAMAQGKPTPVRVSIQQDFNSEDRETGRNESADRLLSMLKNRQSQILRGMGELDAPLKPRYQPGPIVPAEMLAKRTPGKATVEFIVDRAGRPQLPRIISAVPAEFGWAAATCVQRWQFTIPSKNGRPADVLVRVPFVFDPDSDRNFAIWSPFERRAVIRHQGVNAQHGPQTLIGIDIGFRGLPSDRFALVEQIKSHLVLEGNREAFVYNPRPNVTPDALHDASVSAICDALGLYPAAIPPVSFRVTAFGLPTSELAALQGRNGELTMKFSMAELRFDLAQRLPLRSGAVGGAESGRWSIRSLALSSDGTLHLELEHTRQVSGQTEAGRKPEPDLLPYAAYVLVNSASGEISLSKKGHFDEFQREGTAFFEQKPQFSIRLDSATLASSPGLDASWVRGAELFVLEPEIVGRTEKEFSYANFVLPAQSLADSRLAASGKTRGSPLTEFVRQMKDDPKFRETTLARAKAGLEAYYQPLFQDLGLPADRLDQFKNLLVEKQKLRFEATEDARDKGISEQKYPDAFYKLIREAQRDVNSRIEALLGKPANARYVKYQTDLAQWITVISLSQAMGSTPTPLTAKQAVKLAAILPRINNEPSVALGLNLSQGSGFLPGPFPSPASDDILNRARKFLAPAQLAELGTLQRRRDYQFANTRANIEPTESNEKPGAAD